MFEQAFKNIDDVLRKEAGSVREEIERLASLCERKPAALDALKKSLPHQAFTGAP